jgi:TPP-dependent pyruvate/acetoin dehydrogenase alpha subunit
MNCRGTSASSRPFLAERLADRAAGYGIAGVTIDSTDLFAALDALRQAWTGRRGRRHAGGR